MGRFYRTSEPTPVDYMYKDNTPLMENVIKANDAGITSNLNTASDLSKELNFNHLDNDAEDVNNLIGDYGTKIDAITADIRKNPSNWRKQVPSINNLKTQLYNDYTNGAISKYIGNYNRRKQVFDEVDKQVQSYNEGKGGVDPYSASVFKQHWDSKFGKTGYDSKTGNYNVYQGGSAMNNMDLHKILGDGLDKLRADKTKEVHEEPGKDPWFKDKITGEKIVLTPERILQTAMGNISGDVMNYLRQRQGVGLISNAVDSNGNLISPYNIDKQPYSKEEEDYIAKLKDLVFKAKDPKIKEQYTKSLEDYTSQLDSRSSLNFDDNSYLSPYLRSLVSQHRQFDTDFERTTIDNKKTATIYTQGQENYRLGLNLQDKQKGRDQLQDQFNQKLDWDKYKFLHPQPKQFAPKGGLVSKNVPEPPVDKETGISKFGTNSWESWETTDSKTNQPTPVISNAGLSSDIDNIKSTIDKGNNDLKTINNQLLSNNITPAKRAALNIAKQNLEVSLEKSNSELGIRRNLYNNIYSEAINNPKKYDGVELSGTQKELYKEFENDIDGSKYLKSIEDLKKKYPNILSSKQSEENRIAAQVDPSISLETLNKTTAEESPQVKAAREKYANYINTKKIIDDNRTKVSDYLRKDPINSDAIDLNSKDSKDVSDIILNSVTGSKIYDDGGKRTVDTDLAGNSFELDNNEPSKNLKKYIADNGVVMHVHKIGTSTRLGDGNGVAQVSFEDPTDKLSDKHYYYISLGDKALYDIGNKFSKHANPQVSGLAKSLVDGESNNIRRQMMFPTFNENTHKNGYDEASGTVIVTGKNSKNEGITLPLTVHKVIDGGKDSYHISLPDGTPFPRTDGNPNGVFNSPEDFIEQYKKQK